MPALTENNSSEQFLRLEEFKRLCRERSLRLTKQRLEVFRAVAASREHPGAEAVFERVRRTLPNISLDTVYRTLASLEEAGVVTRVGASHKARFDARPEPHYHFVCTNCAEVYDVFPPAGSRGLPVPENIREFGEVKNVNLQFRGICRRCLSAANDVKKQ